MHCASCGTQALSGQRYCTKCGAPVEGRYGVSPAAFEGTRPAYSDDPPYAGFWLRFGGYLLDTVLIFAVVKVAALAVLTGGTRGSLPTSWLISFGGTWLYYSLMESSSRQATLGKMAVGIKVTDLHGNRISFGRATGRYFAKLVSSFTMLIGYLMAGFTARRQGLHDMMAGTLVVFKDRDSEEIANAGPAARQSGAVVAFAIIGAFFGIALIGILAAIAVPAYQNYVVRAQIAEGVKAAEPYKQAIEQAAAQGKDFGSMTTESLGMQQPPLKYVSSMQVRKGVVIITFGGAANQLIAGKTLLIVPGTNQEHEVVWTCGRHPGALGVRLAVENVERYTTVTDNVLPTGCRA